MPTLPSIGPPQIIQVYTSLHSQLLVKSKGKEINMSMPSFSQGVRLAH